MSFRCEECNEPQPIGVAPIMVVTHKRSYVPAPGSEIVKEVKACAPCAEPLIEAGPTEMEPMKNEALLESLRQAELPDPPGSWR